MTYQYRSPNPDLPGGDHPITVRSRPLTWEEFLIALLRTKGPRTATESYLIELLPVVWRGRSPRPE